MCYSLYCVVIVPSAPISLHTDGPKLHSDAQSLIVCHLVITANFKQYIYIFIKFNFGAL